ncbi:piggyBac transposable element-derived protein 4-like [Centruroides sculpturatus]|uniref:piggyBac transposable element-derived protein 4-like n=1 Tax=Centruroides sculpturatus TaxID=218467 RepID=UPI000C6E5905|nr:piggyBac transposable element-derived protein 4-like [Centruroides sculpturatus]XP_023241867.1 piggyBac transposable element-derived protein 4-like [Centruroides sculpturatus]
MSALDENVLFTLYFTCLCPGGVVLTYKTIVLNFQSSLLLSCMKATVVCVADLSIFTNIYFTIMASTSKIQKVLDNSDLLDNIENFSDTISESDSDPDVSVYEGSDNDSDEDIPSPSLSNNHTKSRNDDDDEDYQEVLSPEQSSSLPFTFLELAGPKHMPPPDSPPIVYFNLFFTMTLLNLIVTESNRYAQQVINGMGNNVPPALKNWTKISVLEIKGFIACILNMGLIKKRAIAYYWSTSSSQATPWFGKMFSRTRFYHLLRFFHLVDNSKLSGPAEEGYDPCAKFQPLVDHANRVFRHYYTPHQQICVDESLVGTTIRTSLLQHLPKKHHQWGIKFWMLCDSVSNYCLSFFTYRRARTQQEKDNNSKFGLGYSVVKKLLETGMYLNKGYHLFVDNFFMSVPLVRNLYSLGTYITGTVRRNKKYLPAPLKSSKFSVGQTSYFRSGPLLACGFREKLSQKNPVLLLSSHARACEGQIVRRGVAKSKPQIILEYNKFMGGVDTSDMMLYAYLDERKTIKYWKKVGFNIIGRMVLNSYLLYKENFGGPGKLKSRYAFYISIIESLEEEWMATKQLPPDPPDPLGPRELRKLPKKKRNQGAVSALVWD